MVHFRRADQRREGPIVGVERVRSGWAQTQQKLARVREEVRRCLGNFILEEDEQTLEGVVLAALAARDGSSGPGQSRRVHAGTAHPELGFDLWVVCAETEVTAAVGNQLLDPATRS